MKDKIRIIGYGMIPGILSVIAINTGLSIIDGTLIILENVCKVTEGKLPFNCIGQLSLVPTIATIWTLVITLKRVSDTKDVNLGFMKISGFLAGVLLYALGFAIGAYLTFQAYSLL